MSARTRPTDPTLHLRAGHLSSVCGMIGLEADSLTSFPDEVTCEDCTSLPYKRELGRTWYRRVSGDAA